MEKADVFDQLGETWGRPAVARTEIRNFSGGGIGSKHMANCDAAGEGPEGRFRLGKRVMYPTDSLVAWMRGMSSKIERSKIDA
jgi:hypothetical protein